MLTDQRGAHNIDVPRTACGEMGLTFYATSLPFVACLIVFSR